MNCIKCGKDTEVKDTRLLESNAIRRRRECVSKKCGIRFTTFEEVSAVQTKRGKKTHNLYSKSKELEEKKARRDVIRELLKDGGLEKLLEE